MPELNIKIIKPSAQDEGLWRSLFAAYAGSGGDYIWNDSKANIVWSWLNDPNHCLECAAAKLNDAQQLIGFISYRETPHPGHACNYGYVQDLFVLPDYRKQGIATRLIEHVAEIGRQRSWKFLRWTTHGDNMSAQHLYDRIAKRKDRVVYELKI